MVAIDGYGGGGGGGRGGVEAAGGGGLRPWVHLDVEGPSPGNFNMFQQIHNLQFNSVAY